MQNSKNGVNMQDVKKSNRGALLTLVYHSSGISRKDIAASLGLTPAAITLITYDLLQNGLLTEKPAQPTGPHKGRKEVLLEIRKDRYISVGAYIMASSVSIAVIDFSCKVLKEAQISTVSCKKNGKKVLAAVTRAIKKLLSEDGILDDHVLAGIGISINGVVDTARGVSVHSYYTIEDETDIRGILEKDFDVPVLVMNNICALAHAEGFLPGKTSQQNMLLVKYGPGVGAAHLPANADFDYQSFRAIQIGHVIVDPHGKPCICGNNGCLETIAGYDALLASVKEAFALSNCRVLYEMCGGDPERITMPLILEAYHAGDPLADRVIRRAAYYLVLTIKNAISILAPASVVLYGEIFEYDSVKKLVQKDLEQYNQTGIVHFSEYNTQLDALAPATTVISHFLNNGAQLR